MSRPRRADPVPPGDLLEREEALAALAGLRAQTRAGRGGLTILRGGAGLGKSRLLDVAADAAVHDGIGVLRTRGDALERSFAWGGTLRLLGDAVRGRRFPADAAAGVALLRGRPAAPTADPEQTAFGLMHALAAVVATLRRDRPLLLVLDDAQWLDARTLGLVRFLLGRQEDLGIGVLLALRPDERELDEAPLAGVLAHPLAQEIVLAPLSPSAVGVMARRTLAATVDDTTCRAVAELTGGNPFYLHELLRTLRDDPAPDLDPMRAAAPPAVRRSILARVASYGPEAGALLRALAVLGDDVPPGWVAELARLAPETATELADRLAAADLIVAGPVLRFTHQLVRASVESGVPPGWAADAHGRAAALVESRAGSLEQVAAHLLLAPVGAVPGAVATLRAAAERAMRRAAPASALDYLERALREPVDAAEQVGLRMALGDAAVASGSARAVEHLRALVDDVAPGRERAAAQLRLGWALHGAGRPRESGDAFAAGAAELTGTGERDTRLPPDDDLATELRIGELTAGMLDAGRAAWAQAGLRDFAGSPGATTPAGRHLRSQLLVARVFSGGTPAEELAGEALVLARESVRGPDRFASWTLWNALGTLSWCDRYADAMTLADEAARRAEGQGSMQALAMAGYARAWPAFWTGRLREAARDADQAVRIWSRGAPGYLPAAVYWLVAADLELGRLEEAEHALAGLDEARWSDTAFFAFVLGARARVAAARGRLDDALAGWLDCGEHTVERMHAHNPTLLPWRTEAAELASRAGDRALAVRLAQDDVDRAQAFGAPRALGEALRASGLATGGERGVEILEEAVQVLGRSGAALPHARAVIDLGEMHRRAGRPREARRHLRDGQAAAVAMGAAALATRAAEELKVAGARPRRRREADPGRDADSLTASELRVALLAAQGLSNREIAQRLFVTIKAVEWHLSRSYEKFGITGRAALWASLAAAGLWPGDPPE